MRKQEQVSLLIPISQSHELRYHYCSIKTRSMGSVYMVIGSKGTRRWDDSERITFSSGCLLPSKEMTKCLYIKRQLWMLLHLENPTPFLAFLLTEITLCKRKRFAASKLAF